VPASLCKTAVLNVVGLSPSLIGDHTPNLRRFRDEGHLATVQPALPAVTCTAQTGYLTGVLPREHGIVANGWYYRETAEVRLWQQADALVQAPRIWDLAKRRDPRFTCANLFWWFAMYASTDIGVTPRPMYPADGRKVPDVWTHPPRLRKSLQERLGRFPLFKFWGPAASIESSAWIADAAVAVDEAEDPTLSLVYLPHLDYVLQKEGPAGPSVPGELGAVDRLAGRLIDHFRTRGAKVTILSEYGIEPVDRPVHLNRVLRDAGYVTVRDELGTERLDPGASRAFVVADHQVAHVYVRDPADRAVVCELLAGVDGVARVLDEDGQRDAGLDHPRSGELVALAEPGCWFTYYFWLDDTSAPDYARTVDIHRKPGYDPCELFLDPTRPLLKPRLLAKVLARKAGIRNLLDVVPLDATLVRGSHGLAPSRKDRGPMLMTDQPDLLSTASVRTTDVCGLILEAVFGT
jgi:predicted AlkP superfamily pyrophosphatase or phosphodiesterase